MSVTATEILYYGTTNIPTDDSSTAGGAIDTGNQITDLDTGKLFGSNISSGVADEEYYAKFHIKNTNATDDLSNGKFYIENAIDDPTSTGIIRATTTAAADDDTKYLQYYFENSVGTPSTENVTLPASPGNVDTTTQFLISRRFRVELRNVIGDTLAVAAGDITLTDASSVVLGKIPEGGYCATGEFDVGVAAALDDTATIANRLTAPGGISFTRTNDLATALDVANAGVLTAGTDQAVWVRWTLQARQLPSALYYPKPFLYGTTA